MAMTQAKLEYYRQYRSLHRDQINAAGRKYAEANNYQYRKDNMELLKAIKRKSYYKKMGDFDNVEAQQRIIDEIRVETPRKASGAKVRFSPEERLARRQATIRKVRYRHVKGVPTFRAPDKCEVCGGSKKICMDHDHSTHTFRGWLCDDCNLALGRLKEDIGITRSLLAYLEKHKVKVEER